MYAHSDEDSGPPSAERAAQIQKARMRQARKILAERRNSTPAVSMPIVQKARLKAIHEKLMKELNTECHSFLEDLYRFWTLKRQQRNGVPLLRRLQAASNQHRQPGLMMVCDEEAKQLRAQMKFWQRLRQDLEKARLLSELIRKREKLKKELFRVQAMTLEIRLQPFVCFLKKLIAKVQDFDKECFFTEPVDENEVPGYSSVIKKPMDFSTMRRKATNHEYSSLKTLESDMKLMIANCMTFNPKDSVYYKAAVRLREKVGSVFREANELAEALNFDYETGLHRCDVEPAVKEEKEDPEVKLDALGSLTPVDQLKALCSAFEARTAAGAGSEVVHDLAKQIEALRKEHDLPETNVPSSVRQRIAELLPQNEKTVNGSTSNTETPETAAATEGATEAYMQPPTGSRRRSRASRQSAPPPLESPEPANATAAAASSRKRPPTSPESPVVDGPIKRRRLSSRSSARAARAVVEEEEEEEEEEGGGMPQLEKAGEIPRRTSPRRQSSCATDSSAGQPSPLPSPTPWKATGAAAVGPTSPRLRQRARSSRGSIGEEVESKEAAIKVAATPAMTTRKSRRRRGGSEVPEEEEASLQPPALEPCSFAAAPGGAIASPSPLDPQLRQSMAFTTYRSCTEDELEDSNVSAPCSRRSPRGHARLLRSVGSPMEEEDEESRRSEEEEEESSFASSLESVLKKSAATAAAAVAATTPSGSVSNSNPDSSGTGGCGSESAGFGANGMPEEMEIDDDEEEDEEDEELLLEGADSETDERATVSSAGDLHLEPLDLVWAKCRGYPWYPGLIIDPDMPRDGYTHNGVPIPVPPEAVLDSGRKARHRRPFLVLFFDQKRTWQWLNRDKLEPLGVDSSLDLYLMHQTRRSVQKKSVRKAYENAVEHLCKVNGRPYPFAEGSAELSPYHS